MRQKEYNIMIETADKFEKSLRENGFDDCFDHAELANTFKEVITDYKKIIKTCKNDGIDVGDEPENVEKYIEDFENANLNEKEEIISEAKEKLISMLGICDDAPAKIYEKYMKDLFDIIEDGDEYDD